LLHEKEVATDFQTKRPLSVIVEVGEKRKSSIAKRGGEGLRPHIGKMKKMARKSVIVCFCRKLSQRSGSLLKEKKGGGENDQKEEKEIGLRLIFSGGIRLRLTGKKRINV